ncbi:hypothetical protein PTTG_29139 [Puccinia triticina 1-1 BBBD Race 1]|uniref:DUF8040 domain-containing protein n=1 Tax=Puccinia triticina (isolate 1-1 / race 1 (BBBD)) TaxID=630390 RepID=A0A180G629_PUCT1|nr:hypothetical protein PTTG_29139 [Puccinia triticina 1-1 BBBD Race 1]
MDNKLFATLAAAATSIMEMNNVLLSVAAAGVACKYLGSIWNTYAAYYGDGGQARYTRFLLDEVRPELFREITRMERSTFNNLVEELTMNGLLKNGRSVLVEEQVLIFLDIVCYNNSMRQTAVKFRRVIKNLTKMPSICYFGIVLNSLVAIYPNYVKFDMDSCNQPEEIAQNPKYQPFKNALGALDGVFIPATVPAESQSPWRNRKHFIAQNVLAAVNFNFDLRNIVKRIFGCIKRKFLILQSAPEIKLKKQVRLVYALCMLWNYIRSHESVNNLFDDPEEDARTLLRTQMGEDESFDVTEEDSIMKHRRERLAKKLWDQYVAYKRSA